MHYIDSVRAELRNAFAEDHPPQLIAVSFAIGVFFTTLPLGSGLLALAFIAYWYNWANRLALFAAVGVMNPFIKPGVYALSFALGSTIFGPVTGLVNPQLTLTIGWEIALRLFVGNLALAAGFAMLGYVLALYGVRTVRDYRFRFVSQDNI